MKASLAARLSLRRHLQCLHASGSNQHLKGQHARLRASNTLILDAQVVGLRQCEICIVCKGCVRPDRLKSPLAVSESWLWDLAARFEVPELSEAYRAFSATC